MFARRSDSAHRYCRVIFLISAFACAQPVALATTFTVTSVADTSGTTCSTTCTLRQAISAANAAAGADTINFAISGSGLHTIAPTSTLPTITGPVTIDGYTQSGSSVNSASVGSNALLRIELSGANAPVGTTGLTLGSGSGPSTIRGLVINGFKTDLAATKGFGIDLAVSPASAIKGCFIGTDASGTTSVPNGFGGIRVGSPSAGVVIGGTALADRNLISGNARDGLELESTSGSVQGNLIGLGKDGVSLLGNAFNGIGVFGGSGNTIGGSSASAGNVIAGNTLAGVAIGSTATGNTIENDAIYGNGLLGIDLNKAPGTTPDGVTANDAGDGDTGANSLQNFPVLTLAHWDGTTLSVAGTLNSTPSRSFRIEYYCNVKVDPAGQGEGEVHIGYDSANTNAAGNATFSAAGAVVGVASGQFITAIAADLTTGDTSEFSAPIRVTTDTTVTNTQDSGTGSLRQAILNANAHAGADTIDFAIPGAGVHTIHLLTPLPLITGAVTIDGNTQAGATRNSLADADDAVLRVEVDASALAAPAQGLSVCAINTTVRGLAMTGAPGAGVGFGIDDLGQDCAAGSANGSRVDDSFVGIRPDGTIAGNGTGVLVHGSKVFVGNTGRNVVSGNGLDGVGFVGPGTNGSSVENTLIGWAPDGAGAAGNGRYGVFLGASATGVMLGFDVFSDAQNRIGNNGVGVFVSGSATANQADGNSIGPNAGLGIDLSPGNASDGVTFDDLNDIDSGGNDLQNFPIINSVARNVGYLGIAGFLDRPDTATALTYKIGVYASAACDASGYGQGERFLGKFDFVSADASVQTFNKLFSTDAAFPVGTGIALTATDPAGNTSEFSQCVPLDPGAQAFTVNSAADTDDGNCTAEAGGCTLREAIAAANTHPGADRISFAIPGGGVHVISLTSGLPTIFFPVDIDGYTQPGSSPNTLADGDDAAIRIQIDGQSPSLSATYGLGICSNDVSVRGFSFTHHRNAALAPGYTGSGSTCGGALSGIVVAGNFVGLAPDGSVAANQGFGIVAYGSGVRIGGAAAADRNVISANGLDGLAMSQCLGSTVDGNYIGTDLSGTLGRGNGQDGVRLSNTIQQPMTVGAGLPNRIAFNRNGILLGSASKAVLFANDFFGNAALAIDLLASGAFDPDGATANDVDEADSGGNDLQNFPALMNAAQDGPNLHLVGSLDVPAGASTKIYQLAFYANAACTDASGRGQGEMYLGYANVALSGTSQEFIVDLAASAPIGSHVAATATSQSGTSEFSPCVTVVGGDHIFANGFQ